MIHEWRNLASDLDRLTDFLYIFSISCLSKKDSQPIHITFITR